jgi:hypothetical protein
MMRYREIIYFHGATRSRPDREKAVWQKETSTGWIRLSPKETQEIVCDVTLQKLGPARRYFSKTKKNYVVLTLWGYPTPPR